jgi:hypothetical protein
VGVLVVALLGCGGLVEPPEPPCPTSEDWAVLELDGKACATAPFVGETLGVAVGELPLGSDVEVVSIGSRATVDGMHDHPVEVRAADGTTHSVRSRALTPWYGTVFLAAHDADVPFALARTSTGLLLRVADDELALDLPADARGPVAMDVGRWGDDQPLFEVRVGTDAPVPFAAVTHGSQGLRQLNVPDAHLHAPEIGDEEPDCAAAEPLRRLPGLTAPVRDIEVPAYAGEADGPARCEARGRVADGRFVVCTHGERHVAFVERSPTRWDRIACGSDPLLELDRSLQYAGVKVVEDASHSWTP